MYRFLRFAAQLLAVLFFLVFFSSSSLSQENALKSKYAYTTSALESAQKLYSQGRYPEALSAYDALISQAKNQQNFEEAVYAMEKKALSLRRLNQLNTAIEVLDEALRVSRKHLPKGHFLAAKIYYTRGTMDHTLANYYSARAFLDTAIVEYYQSTSYDSSFYKRVVEYKFYAYQYSEGSQDTLIRYMNKLIELERALAKGDPDPNVILRLYQSYPEIYIQKGDFEQALAYAIEGYQYANENRDRVSNRFYAEAQLQLAEVFYYKKEYQDAIKIILRALPIVESTPRNEMPEYYAFNNLAGISYMGIGDYELALPYLRKAAEVLMDKGGLVDDRAGAKFYSLVMINMGFCYNFLGQKEKAEEVLIRSLSRMKQLVSIPNPDFHKNYEGLGDYYFSSQAWGGALNAYDSALRNGLVSYQSSTLSFPEEVSDGSYSYTDLRTLMKKSDALKNIGILNSDKDMLFAAQNYVEKTHSIIRSNRDAFVVSEGKLFLSENFKRLYEIGVEVCHTLFELTKDEAYMEKAMLFTRQSKAILFLEQSQEFDLVINNALSKEIKDEFFRAKTNIELLQNSFYSLIDNSVTSDSVIHLNQKLLLARAAQGQLKDSIKNILIEFGENVSSVQSILTEHKLAEIPSNHALIEYFYGEENIFVMSKSASNYAFHKVSREERLEAAIGELIETVSNPPSISNINQEFQKFKQNSLLLYTNLIKPVIENYKGLEHLIIIPDDVLSRIPFEVFLSRVDDEAIGFNELDYLIKSYSIQYELSSELYQEGRKNKEQGNGLMAVGYEQPPQMGQLGSGTLPGTEDEIKYLQNTLDGTFLIGDTGTKQIFLQSASEFDVLHLAIHGKADSVNRYESSLIFNGAEDNVLNTSDLYLAGLKARLAVLSACESGSGTLNKGEGTFSIARGFALVGVPSIVMSLWKVNDRVTSDLMMEMYDHFVNEGMDINAALRTTKLNHLERNDEYLGHPYYWAAFLQLGEDVNYQEKSRLSTINIILLGLILGVLPVALVIRKRRRAK